VPPGRPIRIVNSVPPSAELMSDIQLLLAKSFVSANHEYVRRAGRIPDDGVDGNTQEVTVIDWSRVILDPTGEVERGEDRALSPRPGTLHGATLALLDNGKPNAALLLEEVGRQLSERFRLQDIKAFTKDYFGTPVDRTQVERIVASCNFAVTAVGD
jgi:hypothetical protein